MMFYTTAGTVAAATTTTTDQSGSSSESADCGTKCVSQSGCGFRGNSWHGATAGASSRYCHTSASDISASSNACWSCATATSCVDQLSCTATSAYCTYWPGECVSSGVVVVVVVAMVVVAVEHL